MASKNENRFTEIIPMLKTGIGMTLGLSSNLDAVTSQYVDVRQQRKLDVLQIYHQKIIPEQSDKPRKINKKAEKWSNKFNIFSLLFTAFYISLFHPGNNWATFSHFLHI